VKGKKNRKVFLAFYPTNYGGNCHVGDGSDVESTQTITSSFNM